MQRLIKNNFRLKKMTKYDVKAPLDPFRRKLILQKQLEHNPNILIKGGNSKTNPYKETYDLVIAEKKAMVDIYTKSKLWSPRFNPKRFRTTFVIPMGCCFLLILYLHYIQIPKRMLKYKREKGFYFPELEEKGWLDNWLEEEYVDDIYPDEVLSEFGALAKEEEIIPFENRENVRNANIANNKAEMQAAMAQLYRKRQKSEESR